MSDVAARIRKIMMSDPSDPVNFPGTLYRDGEVSGDTPPEGTVLVDGVVRTYGFHPERLEASRPEVVKIIREVVQDNFFVSKGGGLTFLALCTDREGRQWGEHRDMEALCCLAMGLKLASWCLPREFWGMLPGGMPYISFNDLEPAPCTKT